MTIDRDYYQGKISKLEQRVIGKKSKCIADITKVLQDYFSDEREIGEEIQDYLKRIEKYEQEQKQKKEKGEQEDKAGKEQIPEEEL